MESSHPKISNIHNRFNPNSSPYLQQIQPTLSILSQRDQTQSIHPISNKFNPNSLPYLKPRTDLSQTPHPTYDRFNPNYSLYLQQIHSTHFPHPISNTHSPPYLKADTHLTQSPHPIFQFNSLSPTLFPTCDMRFCML